MTDTAARASAALDPDVAEYLAEIPPIVLDPADGFVAARHHAATIAAAARGALDPDLLTIPTLDEFIDGAHVRWYGPEPTVDRDIIVYLHGGGWVLGDVDSYDDDARILAKATGARVASVDYRRAPEHPFPAPLEDCLGVIRHAARLPRRALGVAGDSAGGNLALGAALDLGGATVDAVLALYPCVDPRGQHRASMRDNGEGYLLTAAAMRLYWEAYLPTENATDDPRAALLNADFRDFPRTVLASAGWDPLRDEVHDLAARLARSGVEVTLLTHPELTHGFQQQVPRVPAATAALESTVAAFLLALERSARARR